MSTADIGLIGLAVMGSNLALNIAEKGYTSRSTTAPPAGSTSSWSMPRRRASTAGSCPKPTSRSFVQAVKPAAPDHHHGQGRQPVDDRSSSCCRI